MRSPVNPVALGIGLVAVALGVGAVIFINRGGRVELTGSILKVRTVAMDESSAVAVIDFRFVNPADYPFVVRQVAVSIEDQDGKAMEGAVVSEVDAKRLFEYYPVLGQKFNETLVARNRITARQSMDRMVAARFETTVERLDSRRKLTVRIEDVDGPASELVQATGPGTVK